MVRKLKGLLGIAALVFLVLLASSGWFLAWTNRKNRM